MKKWIIILLLVVVVITVIVLYKYNAYKNEVLNIQKINTEYQNFSEGEIVGTSIMTLINRTMDLNNKNGIKLDENNLYIENESNSIKIDIKFQESDETFPMEKIAMLGSEQFIKNYATAYFKCSKIEYHKQTNMIKYLLFEQI